MAGRAAEALTDEREPRLDAASTFGKCYEGVQVAPSAFAHLRAAILTFSERPSYAADTRVATTRGPAPKRSRTRIVFQPQGSLFPAIWRALSSDLGRPLTLPSFGECRYGK